MCKLCTVTTSDTTADLVLAGSVLTCVLIALRTLSRNLLPLVLLRPYLTLSKLIYKYIADSLNLKILIT